MSKVSKSGIDFSAMTTTKNFQTNYCHNCWRRQ